MTLIEAIQALGGGLFFVAALIVGFRLLFLAQRNRGLPELALGLSYLLGGTFGAFLEVIAIAGDETGLAPAQLGSILMLGKLFGVVGLSCSMFFIWWVFRRDEPWGGALALATISAAAIGFFGFAAAGCFQDGVSSGPWMWIEFAARAVSPCWLGLEAGYYHVQMKRRMRLGLADPVVTARFLLWTVAAGCSFLVIASAIPPLLLGAKHPVSLGALVVFGFSGMGIALAYGLAFFPPAAYQRRLRAQAAANS